MNERCGETPEAVVKDDLERARHREAQELVGLCPRAFAGADQEACGDRISEGEA